MSLHKCSYVRSRGTSVKGLVPSCFRGRHTRGTAGRGVPTQEGAKLLSTATGDMGLRFYLSVHPELDLCYVAFPLGTLETVVRETLRWVRPSHFISRGNK